MLFLKLVQNTKGSNSVHSSVRRHLCLFPFSFVHPCRNWKRDNITSNGGT